MEGIDLSEHKRARARVLKECAKIKIELTSSEEADLQIDNIAEEHDLEITITRAEFEDLCKPIFDKFVPLLTKAL